MGGAAQVVVLMVGRTAAGASGAAEGTQWVEALWAIYVGVSGPLVALVVGQQAGMAVAHALARREVAVAGQPAAAAAADAGPAAKTDGEASTLPHQPPQQSGQPDGRQQPQPGSRPVAEATAAEEALLPPAASQGQLAAAADASADGGCVTVTVQSAAVAEATEPTATTTATNTINNHSNNNIGNANNTSNGNAIVLPTGAGAMAAAANAAEPRLPLTAPPPAPPAVAPQPQPLLLPHLAADVAALLALLTLTGVSAAYAHQDREPAGNPRRMWWIAILLGPPGAVLRWYLSRFNAVPASWRGCSRGCGLGFGGSSSCGGSGSGSSGSGKVGGGEGSWAWLQLGTFVANLAACCLNFTAEAILFRQGGSMTDLQVCGCGACEVGFVCACWSGESRPMCPSPTTRSQFVIAGVVGVWQPGGCGLVGA